MVIPDSLVGGLLAMMHPVVLVADLALAVGLVHSVVGFQVVRLQTDCPVVLVGEFGLAVGLGMVQLDV